MVKDRETWHAAVRRVTKSQTRVSDWTTATICKSVKALESITTNKASGGDGIPAELFKILKDDVVKVLDSIWEQIWKTQQWSQDWKRSVFIPIPKKENAKNLQTIIQLCSFHLLARYCSKSFKPGFNSIWIENFQMNKLYLEKEKNQRSNCQHLLDLGVSKEIQEKHLLLLHWLW